MYLLRTIYITFRADKKAESREMRQSNRGGAKRRSMRPLPAAAATRVDASSTSAALQCKLLLFAVNRVKNSRLRRAKRQLEYPFQNATPVGPRLVVPTHCERVETMVEERPDSGPQKSDTSFDPDGAELQEGNRHSRSGFSIHTHPHHLILNSVV